MTCRCPACILWRIALAALVVLTLVWIAYWGWVIGKPLLEGVL